MSDPHPNDASGLALAARLQVLRDACVTKARFNDSGDLTFVEFGSLDGGPATDEQPEPKVNPVREAALRLSRPLAKVEPA